MFLSAIHKLNIFDELVEYFTVFIKDYLIRPEIKYQYWLVVSSYVP